MNNFKIKKGDTVAVIAGKDKGKTGKVLKSIFTRQRVLIEGVNVYKKHVKPRRTNEKGQIIHVPRSIHISNVQLLCPSCGKAVRVSISRIEGKRVRTCKKCMAHI